MSGGDLQMPRDNAADQLPTWPESAKLFSRALEDREMTGFSADWLTLREPFDMRARNPVSSRCGRRFACGTSFGADRRSCLRHGIDVARVERATSTPAKLDNLSTTISACWRARRQQQHSDDVVVTAVPLDLNRDLEAALDGPVDLVTTSALLDLVSEPWLERLAVEIAARTIPLYAALSYDGTDRSRSARSARCSYHCGRQCAPAHGQGLRPRAGTGRGGRRDRAFSIARLFRGARPIRLGR